MIEVNDHTPIIYPMRNASELVKKSISGNFKELKMSEWRPIWVKKVLKDIEDGKIGGLVVPESKVGVFETNTLLKAASGYHELNGHIDSLMSHGSSNSCCVKYHAAIFRLMYHQEKRLLGDAVDSIISSNREFLIQELIGNTSEINALIPFVKHESLGKEAEKRINYLKNLGEEEDWFCDMSTGQHCIHRSSMYLRNLLSEDFSLNLNSIIDLSYGFVADAIREHESPEEESQVPFAPDSVLLEIVQSGSQFKNLGTETISRLKNELYEKPVKMQSNQFAFNDTWSTGKVYYIEPHLREGLFHQDMSGCVNDLSEYEKKLPKELFTSPLCDMIAKSFVVITKQDFSLFVAKDALPKEEKMRIRSLEVLKNLKALIIETSSLMNQLVSRNCITCKSRNNSLCLFKEKFSTPNIRSDIRKMNFICDCFLENKRIQSVYKNLTESLENFVKMRKKNE